MTTQARPALALWAGLLSGPLAWAVQLPVCYALSEAACSSRSLAGFHAVTAACLLVALTGLWLAWRNWQSVGGWPSATDEAPVARTRLLSVLGLLVGSLLTL